jgi:hypothetical protein
MNLLSARNSQMEMAVGLRDVYLVGNPWAIAMSMEATTLSGNTTSDALRGGARVNSV